MPQRITMADVAREAGVSLMTVSRVVNNKGEISEVTRLRVQEVIDRLGYRPSDIARGLATDRTGTVGLVVLDNANPFFSELARGVEHVAYAEGYNVFLCNTEEDTEREKAVLRSLEEKRVDGLILCSSRLDDASLKTSLSRHPAAVLINRWLDSNEYSVIMTDDEKGARLVMEHLIQSGHSMIGFIAGPHSSYSGQQRAKGYCAALTAAGLPYRPEWQRSCRPVVEAGRETARALLAEFPEITALFCYNDLTGVGALQACADLGRAVPNSVAVTGFDDVPLAALVTPALTTCRVPMYEMGRQAMQLLLLHINGSCDDCGHIVFQPELIVRASAP